jgi:hypothetical protein
MEDSLGVKTYNLGMDGYNFYMQYYRGRAFVRRNRLPRMIILSLDFGTLDTLRYLYNPSQFLAYLDDKDVATATKAYEGFNWYDYAVPLVRYSGYEHVITESLRSLFRLHPGKPDRYKGYENGDVPWNGDLEWAEANYQSFTFGWIPSMCGYSNNS